MEEVFPLEHCRVRASTQEFCRDTNIQFITLPKFPRETQLIPSFLFFLTNIKTGGKEVCFP